MIGRKTCNPEHCKVWSNFEFDRNIVSGTGAWPVNYSLIILDNGLSPIQCRAIIQTNADLLLIEDLGTKFNETRIADAAVCGLGGH